MAQSSLRIGVDTGGTFTDVVLVDTRGTLLATHKLPSTPDDPARAVLDGIAAVLAKAGLPDRRDADGPAVVHGSTVATNALLEGDTGGAALVTTAGFEDTLHIARQDRPQLYALVPRRPDPPVAAARCFGVPERLDADGAVVAPLQDDAIAALVAQLAEAGASAVAVSLLHSYANPAHERAVADALRQRFGDALHLTISSELLPEYREYERAATCVVNAAVAPKMTRYLGRLRDALGDDRLHIMGSHGGTLPVADALAQPVRTVLSGPAGGVLGAGVFGDRLITLDMGGTSTDVAVIDGQPLMSTQGTAAGLPVKLPMVDIHTIGAGGGSIAWLDAGGALRVGPRSAGAVPGPACYGGQRRLIDRGAQDGWLPTVTDANVVLGRIPADTTLGEGVGPDADAARDAIVQLAARAGLGTQDAARGILRVVEAGMMRAVQRVTLQAGRDPRGFALMPFGGAGALHACALAQSLGIARVIVPPSPGLLSAVGMLTAPGRQIVSKTLMWTLAPGHEPDLDAPLDDLARSIDDAWTRRHRPVDFKYTLDMRYVGQSHEITLDLGEWRDAPSPDAGCLEHFHRTHERLYGYREDNRPVELVAVRCIADGPRMRLRLSRPAARATPVSPVAGVVHRGDLVAGQALTGPLIIAEYSATTYLAPGWSATPDERGSLLLEHADA